MWSIAQLAVDIRSELVLGFAGTSTDSLAEWSKALAPGASPQERGFETHSCHLCSTNVTLPLLPDYRSLVWSHKQFVLVLPAHTTELVCRGGARA